MMDISLSVLQYDKITNEINENQKNENDVELLIWMNGKTKEYTFTLTNRGSDSNYKLSLADLEKYTDEDRRKLGDMLNLLGLEQEKVDLNKLKAQLKEIEAKTKEIIQIDQRLLSIVNSVKNVQHIKKQNS